MNTKSNNQLNNNKNQMNPLLISPNQLNNNKNQMTDLVSNQLNNNKNQMNPLLVSNQLNNDNNQMTDLVSINNPNISEEKCVEKTDILKRAFVEKIQSKSEPGIDRSLYLYHTTATTDLIGLYSNLHGIQKDKELALRLNTMTDQKR